MPYRLMIAEDDAAMRGLLAELAQDLGFEVECCSDGLKAQTAIRVDPPDALLADLRMPDLGGIELIEWLASDYPEIPVAIITGYASVPDVVRAFRAGAMDLITKPFDNADVRDVLNRFHRHLERERRIEAVKARLDTLEDDAPLLVLESRTMQQTLGLIQRVAELDTPVLLGGETGSGKGVLARQIHASSSRSNGPWFSINCGALSDSVAESELFGHERGAFTGAAARKRGVLELADGGTLFLDEINSASPAIQTRLLEFVQDQTLRRVGGERLLKVDVRLIAASNQDLSNCVREGKFREDLWYRLNVFPLIVPPLRERRDDIVPLAEYFLSRFAHQTGLTACRFSDSAEQSLLNHNWPGNVRELENCIHRAVILCDSEVVDAPQLALHSEVQKPHIESLPWQPEANLAEVETHWIQYTLNRCDGNKSRAARCLGIDVSTLHRKLRTPSKTVSPS